jgi:large subunit ribosomal protein L21
MTDPQEPTTAEATTAQAETITPEPVAAPTTPEVVSDATAPELEAAEAPTTPEPVTAAAAVAATPTDQPRRAAKRKQVLTPRELPPYAIIETGGKQYRVSVGDTLSVEKLDHEVGTDITFDRVLLVGGDGSTRVGTPVVAGATVAATVADQYRGEKLVIFKYKPKKRYRRKTGHRQSLTRLAITAINA